MANCSSILATRTPMNSMKRQKDMTTEDEANCSNYPTITLISQSSKLCSKSFNLSFSST